MNGIHVTGFVNSVVSKKTKPSVAAVVWGKSKGSFVLKTFSIGGAILSPLGRSRRERIVEATRLLVVLNEKVCMDGDLYVDINTVLI